MCSSGQLTRVLPKVYAVGHTAPDRHADLWAAVLYAGEGAAISHATAAHHRDLLDFAPSTIEVSTPHSVRSIPGVVKVYRRRDRARELFEGIPTTLIADTVIDTAATGTPAMIRRILATLDYKRLLTMAVIEEIDSKCGPGRSGSTAAKKALNKHKPQYAQTRSDVEMFFIDICDHWHIPPPICNTKLHDITVDAYWPDFNLVVEIDGGGNHTTIGQVDNDRTNDLILRAHGLTVLRYSKRQINEDLKLVRADLITHMQTTSLSATDRKAA